MVPDTLKHCQAIQLAPSVCAGLQAPHRVLGVLL